jgi:hypothetical protein
MTDPAVGLCARCVESKVVENERGSRFYLCELSKRDPRYRKYPQLPVLRCDGFTAATDG